MNKENDDSSAHDAANVIVDWLVDRAQEGKKVGQELNDINDIRSLIDASPSRIGFNN